MQYLICCDENYLHCGIVIGCELMMLRIHLVRTQKELHTLYSSFFLVTPSVMNGFEVVLTCKERNYVFFLSVQNRFNGKVKIIRTDFWFGWLERLKSLKI
jgi:hypothetical protein